MKLSMSVFATSQQQQRMQRGLWMSYFAPNNSSNVCKWPYKRVQIYTCILVYVTLKSTRIKIWAEGKSRPKTMTKIFFLALST